MASADRILSGRYVLGSKVGEGGMGLVWRARDRRLDRDVAIKLLHPQIASVPEQRQRFDREAHALAALEHENVVRVYDYAESGDEVYLVLEFVDGESLASTVAERLPLDWEGARGYAIPVCRALAYAHEHGVIHRDLTPANVLVESATGRVVVTDFGLARVARGPSSVTSAGVLVGTPEFWSPEQATGTDNDPPTDMYALGCVLFLLLSGHLPFEGEDRLAVGLRRAHEDAPSLAAFAPALPEEATRVVDQLLQRQEDRRPSASQTIHLLHGDSAREWPTIRMERPSRPSDPPVLVPDMEAPTRVIATSPVGRDPVDESDSRRGRVREAAIVVVVAALVAAGAAIGVFKAVALGFGSDRGSAPGLTHAVTLPPLVGLPLNEGLRRLRLAAERFTVETPPTRISRVYSERAPNGVIVGQRPTAYARLSGPRARVALAVSRGSAFAPVPQIEPGNDPKLVASRLAAAGFGTWRRFTPSWTVRKGSVVGVLPRVGAKVRRPAKVTILVASGYPRSRVPTLRGLSLPAAESLLAGKHLRPAIHYVPSRAEAGRVMSQSPPPGSVSVLGRTVQLKVGRAMGWARVLSRSGAGEYSSPAFTVRRQWRIRYRCWSIYPDGFVLAGVSWTSPDELSDGFTMDRADNLHTVVFSSGPGTFQLHIVPFAPGTTWYVEIQTRE
jgi:eukaryotic-like serine/threonine-protein kinase